MYDPLSIADLVCVLPEVHAIALSVKPVVSTSNGALYVLPAVHAPVLLSQSGLVAPCASV